MANTETTSHAQPAAAATQTTTMAVFAPAIGWLIPGDGHLIQRRWIRVLLLMATIVTMFAFGLAIDGKNYKPNTGDLLDMLGFVGDLCAGGLYIVSRAMDWGNTAISYATADYGTKFIVVAGLLNVMALVDAHQIAIGKKS